METHWASKIKSLPVLPQVAMRVTERMQSPHSTVNEISDLLRSDVGLSSKVLKLANSSYYSVPGGVSDVSKALQYLGFNTISQIVLTSSVFGSFKSQGLKEFPLSSFWMHSFGVGQMAELLSKTLGIGAAADAFIGGLMHDVGKLILLEVAPEQLQKIVSFSKENKVSFLNAELALGFDNHVDLGVELAKHWNLPESLVQIIYGHHGKPTSNLAKLIEWSNLWINSNHVGNSGSHDPDHESKLQALTETLKISPKSITLLETQFKKEFEKAGAILGGH